MKNNTINTRNNEGQKTLFIRSYNSPVMTQEEYLDNLNSGENQ